MPIYEFKCSSCGKEFEELVLAASQEIECPACRCEDVERLMSRCRHKSGASALADIGESASAPSFSASSGGCAGCSGGNCSTCG